MVGISHSKGVVLWHHYKKTLTTDKMVQIIKAAMAEAFNKSIDSLDRKFLMDGCPRQNFKEALKTVEDVGTLVFKVPSRSPDLNSIGNIYAWFPKHFVSKSLKRILLGNIRWVFSKGAGNNAGLQYSKH